MIPIIRSTQTLLLLYLYLIRMIYLQHVLYIDNIVQYKVMYHFVKYILSPNTLGTLYTLL